MVAFVENMLHFNNEIFHVFNIWPVMGQVIEFRLKCVALDNSIIVTIFCLFVLHPSILDGCACHIDKVLGVHQFCLQRLKAPGEVFSFNWFFFRFFCHPLFSLLRKLGDDIIGKTCFT